MSITIVHLSVRISPHLLFYIFFKLKKKSKDKVTLKGRGGGHCVLDLVFQKELELLVLNLVQLNQ